MIPKIIHQTWKNEKIPDRWKEAVESCKEKNKDYKYILWTDKSMKEFVKKEFPEFYKTYTEYPHNIQRCDSFRFLVLYKYGGFYMDMDVICKKSLNTFRKYDLVLVKSGNYDTLTNSFMGSTRENKFMEYCMNKLIQHKDSYSLLGKHLHIMHTTGPFFINDRAKEFMLSKKKDNYYLLSKEEYTGDCNVCNIDTCKGGVYFGHVKGNSWHSIDSTIYNGMLCLYKKVFDN